MNQIRLLKTGLFLAVLGFAGQAHAQFNHTFLGGNGQSAAITDASSGAISASCILGSSNTYGIILKKISFAGGTFFDKGYNIMTPGATLTPYKVLHTANDEYIVVGMIYRSGTNTNNPFAARFNATGNFLWLHEYNSNPAMPGAIANGRDVNICQVQDGPVGSESYIIVASGANPTRTAASGTDIFVNALSIDGNGMLQWNKKYFPVGVPPLSSNLTDVRDYAESLVYVASSDGSKRYFIGGGSEKYGIPGGAGYGLGFFMSIDNKGNIKDQYQQIPTSLHWWQDAIFDNTTDEIVLAYTTGNAGTGISTSASALGMTRIHASLGLTLVGHDFYARDNSNESYFTGNIREDASRSAYLLGSTIYDVGMQAPAIFKIDKFSRNIAFCKLYNRNRTAFNAGLISLSQGGVENYVTTEKVQFGSSSYGMRVISTDINGDACGSFPDNTVHTSRTDVTTSYTYAAVNESGYFFHLMSEDLLSGMSDCNGAPVPDDYRLAAPSSQELKVYPTLLRQETEITLEVPTGEGNTSLHAFVCTMEGRLIQRRSYPLQQGSNHLQMNVSGLPPGNYLLRVQSTDGAVLRTVQLMRL